MASKAKTYRAVLEAKSGVLLGGVTRHEYAPTDTLPNAVMLRDIGQGIEREAGREALGYVEVRRGRGAWLRLLFTEVR